MEKSEVQPPPGADAKKEEFMEPEIEVGDLPAVTGQLSGGTSSTSTFS